MYKSRLQEYCHSMRWKLPEYSTTREGQDHCPQFKAIVVVNGSSFSTPHSSKSSKEAHNLVASIAYQHLTGSSNASTALQVSPALIVAQHPKMNGPLQAASFSVVNSSNRDDMAHLYKTQLQIYAQKRNLKLPVYVSERKGPLHACHFKSKVILKEKMYESYEYFRTVKDAENAAAKVALLSVSVSSADFEVEDPGVYKNLLQELAQKENSFLPVYVTTRSGPSQNPIFSSTVQINEESFTGQEAKTKKLAEINAAKVAYIALRERKGKQNCDADLPGYHVSDSPFAPVFTSNTVHMEEVRYNKGQCHQDTDAKYTVVKPEVYPNVNQNIYGLNSHTMSVSQYSSSAPIQSPSQSAVSAIHQQLESSDASLSHKKIKFSLAHPI